MSLHKEINKCHIRLEICDITDMEVEAFVFYARSDLKLGSGFGNAIAMRGGPVIQEELNQMSGMAVGDVVITSAGNMKAKRIIHAVGPKFQEQDTELKLQKTMINALKLAQEKGIKQIAFPPMGAGFYGIPLPVCAEIMLHSIVEFARNNSGIREIIICALDKREYSAFQNKMTSLTALG